MSSISSTRPAASAFDKELSKGADYSIYQLDVRRVIKHINDNQLDEEISEKESTKVDGRTPLNQLIETIVKIYNKHHRPQEYKPLEECSFTPTHHYSFQGYYCESGGKTSATREAESTQGEASSLPASKRLSFLHFFYRSTPLKEIAVLTVGAARGVIERCVDYTYSRAIERILDPNRITKITRYSLVGRREKETLLLPPKQKIFSVSALYYYVESYQCDVKNDSELHQLDLFPQRKQRKGKLSKSAEEDSDRDTDVPEEAETEKPKGAKQKSGQLSPNARINIEVTSSHFRIKRRIVLKKCSPLLDMVSTYVRDDIKKKKEKAVAAADPLFQYLHVLTESPWHQRDDLNRRLVNMVYSVAKTDQDAAVCIRHKHLDDYAHAVEFQLKVEGETKFAPLESDTDDESLPTIKKIVKLILEKQKDALKSKADFFNIFTGSTLRFRKNENEDWTSQPLLDCLEGEVRDKDKKTHIKLKNIFFHLKANFHTQIETDFKSVLEKTLAKPDDEAQLPHPWPSPVTMFTLKDVLGLKKAPKTLKDMLVNAKILSGKSKKEKKEPGKKSIRKKDAAEEGTASRILKTGPLTDEIKALTNLKTKKKQELLTSFLKREFPYFNRVKRESHYNSLYFLPSGTTDTYLVFDTIEPPSFLIELCDVLKDTGEVLYLYQVKKTLSNHAREACSQILNAAKEMRSALSLHQSTSYIEELHKEATKDLATCKKNREYLEKVKAQLEKLGKDGFLELFRSRKIVFVYACQEHGLRAESALRRRLKIEELKEIDSLKKKNAEELKAIYSTLEQANFIDEAGRLTDLFYAISNTRISESTKTKSPKAKQFKLDGVDDETTRKIYHFLCKHYRSKLGSTIAKLELLRLYQELIALGFEGFKICEIRNRVRDSDMKLDQDAPASAEAKSKAEAEEEEDESPLAKASSKTKDEDVAAEEEEDVEKSDQDEEVEEEEDVPELNKALSKQEDEEESPSDPAPASSLRQHTGKRNRSSEQEDAASPAEQSSPLNKKRKIKKIIVSDDEDKQEVGEGAASSKNASTTKPKRPRDPASPDLKDTSAPASKKSRAVIHPPAAAPKKDNRVEKFQKQQKILSERSTLSLSSAEQAEYWEYMTEFQSLVKAKQVLADATHQKILQAFSPWVGLYNRSDPGNACWFNASIQACGSVQALVDGIRVTSLSGNKVLQSLHTLLKEMKGCDKNKIKEWQKELYFHLVTEEDQKNKQQDPDELFNKTIYSSLDSVMPVALHVPDTEKVDYHKQLNEEMAEKFDYGNPPQVLIVTIEKAKKEEGEEVTPPEDIEMARKALLESGESRANAQKEINDNIIPPKFTQSTAHIEIGELHTVTHEDPDQEDIHYKLRACVIHQGGNAAGNRATGHYVTVARGMDDQWRLYDDHRVKHLATDEWKKNASKFYIQYWERVAKASKESAASSSAASSAAAADSQSPAEAAQKKEKPPRSILALFSKTKRK